LLPHENRHAGLRLHATPAQLQAVAPAFFLYPGTNYVLASRLPDYALVAGPSAPAPSTAIAIP
jgi:hypothetical protein